MALIVDPDLLNDSTEIVISTGGKTVQLVATGNLSTDGVTIKCVYSKLKELWKSNSTYIKIAFPAGPITDEQFEMINGWDWADDTTRYLLRTGGWAVKDSGGVSLEEWAGIISLGSIGGADQAYFLQADGNSVDNFQLTGAVNQAVKIYGDVSHGNFDYRSYFKIYCRIYQKIYAFSQLSDIGISTMAYQTYRFPLANSTDPKITHADVTVSGSEPYTGMMITWYAVAQQRDIGGTNRDFHVIIDGNNGTAEQVYEFVQYELRQALDVDDGAGEQIGNKTAALLRFVGDTLYTQAVTEGGVFIDNYQTSDINRLVFIDDLETERTFPYTAVLRINFGDNLVNDNDAKYWIYFTTTASGDYGTTYAILVQDYDSVDMTDTISGVTYIERTFAYDSNSQGGRTPATEAAITAVAIGLDTAQFVKATGNIARSTANTISLVAPLERNYQNPV